MIRFLIRMAINLVTAAVAILVAAWVLGGSGFSVGLAGFGVAVAVFTVAQAVLTPFILKMARRYATPLLGGIGIVSTLAGLLLASLVPGGISISGVTTWILAALIVWLITALGGWALVVIFLKERAGAAS